MYQKRLSAPRVYPINRKAAPFVISAQGPHTQESGVPLLVVLRDMLQYGENRNEVQDILQRGEVYVDGTVRTDPHFRVGFLDVIDLPSAQKAYRVLFDAQRLYLQEIQQANMKVCRVTDLKSVKGGRFQIALHDGKTVLSDTYYQTGTGLVLSVPDLSITDHVPLQKTATAIVLTGSHRGAVGTVSDLSETTVTLETGDIEITVPRSNVCPIRNKEALLGDSDA